MREREFSEPVLQDFAVHSGGICLECVLRDLEHLDLHRALAEDDLDDVARLDLIGALADLPFTVMRAASQASFATVRRLMRRETLRYLSSLILRSPCP